VGCLLGPGFRPELIVCTNNYYDANHSLSLIDSRNKPRYAFFRYEQSDFDYLRMIKTRNPTAPGTRCGEID
jgi:hypothetical protein